MKCSRDRSQALETALILVCLLGLAACSSDSNSPKSPAPAPTPIPRAGGHGGDGGGSGDGNSGDPTEGATRLPKDGLQGSSEQSKSEPSAAAVLGTTEVQSPQVPATLTLPIANPPTALPMIPENPKLSSGDGGSPMEHIRQEPEISTSAPVFKKLDPENLETVGRIIVNYGAAETRSVEFTNMDFYHSVIPWVWVSTKTGGEVMEPERDWVPEDFYASLGVMMIAASLDRNYQLRNYLSATNTHRLAHVVRRFMADHRQTLTESYDDIYQREVAKYRQDCARQRKRDGLAPDEGSCPFLIRFPTRDWIRAFPNFSSPVPEWVTVKEREILKNGKRGHWVEKRVHPQEQHRKYLQDNLQSILGLNWLNTQVELVRRGSKSRPKGTYVGLDGENVQLVQIWEEDEKGQCVLSDEELRKRIMKIEIQRAYQAMFVSTPMGDFYGDKPNDMFNQEENRWEDLVIEIPEEELPDHWESLQNRLPVHLNRAYSRIMRSRTFSGLVQQQMEVGGNIDEPSSIYVSPKRSSKLLESGVSYERTGRFAQVRVKVAGKTETEIEQLKQILNEGAEKYILPGKTDTHLGLKRVLSEIKSAGFEGLNEAQALQGIELKARFSPQFYKMPKEDLMLDAYDRLFRRELGGNFDGQPTSRPPHKLREWTNRNRQTTEMVMTYLLEESPAVKVATLENDPYVDRDKVQVIGGRQVRLEESWEVLEQQLNHSSLLISHGDPIFSEFVNADQKEIRGRIRSALRTRAKEIEAFYLKHGYSDLDAKENAFQAVIKAAQTSPIEPRWLIPIGARFSEP